MALYSLVLVPTHPMRVTRILPLPTQVLGARDPATSLLAVLELCVSKPSLSCSLSTLVWIRHPELPLG
jgi:hypothetical protein